VVTAGESIEQIVCLDSGLLWVITPGHDEGADVTTQFVRRDDFFFERSIRQDRYEPRQTLVAALP